jgi:NADH dehydrogenase (ubiquinone) 1 alpha/beta subcomplex 1, acyl-carrier protein
MSLHALDCLEKRFAWGMNIALSCVVNEDDLTQSLLFSYRYYRMFLAAARLSGSRAAVRALGSSSRFALRPNVPVIHAFRCFSSPPVSGVILEYRKSCARGIAKLISHGFAALLSMQTFLSAGEVTERIMGVVKNFDQVDPTKVTAATKFTEDLGLDSLDIVEVVMAIEDEFAIEIPDTEADAIVSIGDAVEYITKHPMAK